MDAIRSDGKRDSEEVLEVRRSVVEAAAFRSHAARRSAAGRATGSLVMLRSAVAR